MIEPTTPVSQTPSPQGIRRRPGFGEWGLLLLCLFLFFWRLGSVPIFDLDEALYVTCARQMVLSGDLVTPRLNSRPLDRPIQTTVAFFEKPILVYWCCAASLRLFGMTEWAARLPSALAALLTTGGVFLAGKRWFGRRAGLLAGLVYATAPMTIADARQMTTDGLLTLWFTGALLAFWGCYRAAECRQQAAPEAGQHPEDHPPAPSPTPPRPAPDRFPSLLFWTFCALAVLTKGAIGLLLPFLVIGVFLLVQGLALRLRRGNRLRLLFQLRLARLADIWPVLKSMRPLSGLLLLLVLAAPWHIRIWRSDERDAQGRTFYQEYVMRQHIGRFKGLDTVHNEPLPTYLAYFLLGFFPWACFAPAAFRRTRSSSPASPIVGAEGAASSAPTAAPSAPTSAPRFLLVWFWTIFIFFSLGAAKLPTYIVPAYPAAALLVGSWLDRVLDGRAPTRSLWRGTAGAFVTAGILLLAVCLAPRFARPDAPIPSAVLRATLHLMLLLSVGCLAAGICFRRRKSSLQWRQIGTGVLVGMMLLVVVVACTEGYTTVQRDVLGPYQQVARDARADAHAGLPVLYYHIIPRRPSMNFYAWDYSPLECKDAPLSFCFQTYVRPSHSEADLITAQYTLEHELRKELAALPDLTMQVLTQRGDPRSGWVLLRIRQR